jgi:apolipoprotein N-acyltransferase
LNDRAGRPALSRPASYLAELAGWRRLLLAFLLGALGALAFAPIHALPVLLLSYPALYWLLGGCRRWTCAFGVGWSFAFGQFIAGLYWIGAAFLVDADRFAWLLPFAVSLLPAGLALFVAPAVALAWAARPGWRRWLALGCAWTLAEWMRAHLFTGFPWNQLGYVWAASEPMMQAAALFGVYGLSLATALAATAPAAFGWRGLVGAATALASLWAGGALRLAGAEVADVAGVRLRIVQPNIDQRDKWRRDLMRGNFSRHLQLSSGPGVGTITHFVWPETAVPYLTGDMAWQVPLMAGLLKPGGLLFAGATRVVGPPLQAWNSLYVIGPDAQTVAVYDKHHLVPFGEYLPLRSLLAPLGVAGVAASEHDFLPGPGPRLWRFPGLPPVQPLICYEVIFPHEIEPEAQWLLNVTNDAWFGFTSGPYQHLAMARFRAVENGIPVMRSANTGISAVIDPYGRVQRRLPLGQAGALDSGLPQALAPTPYRKWRDPPFMALVLLAAIGCFSRRPNVLYKKVR